MHIKSKINTSLYKSVALGRPYLNAEKELFLFLKTTIDASCYVSCSFGKDSSVVAHAANFLYNGIPIFAVDPGCPTHWLQREKTMWISYAKRMGWNLKFFQWDKWSCVGGEKDENKARSKIHADMFFDMTEYADSLGLTTRIIGLRAEESKGRRISLRKLGMDAVLADGRRRIIPVARWSTDFIWAYIIKHGLPWLEIYDRLGPEARNGLVGVNGTNKGRLTYLKLYFPEAWRFAKQVLSNEVLNGV